MSSLAYTRTRRSVGEQAIRYGLLAAAAVSVLTTILIVLSLLRETIAFFGDVPIGDFLFGTKWTPLLAADRQSLGVIPLITGLLRTGIAEGYVRPVDPELTIRSIIGPIMLHILLDEVFGVRPADGLALDRLIENHLTILFDGLRQPQSNKRFMAT